MSKIVQLKDKNGNNLYPINKNYENNIKAKTNILKYALNSNSQITIQLSNRGVYLISTTSNSSGIQGLWVVCTCNAEGAVKKLSDTGSLIEITSTSDILTIKNNANYKTNVYITIAGADNLDM